MKRFRVLFVNKVKSGAFEGDISHIGGFNENGENWTYTIQEAIEGISSGKCEFYIVENMENVRVGICALDESETFLMAKGKLYLYNLVEELPESPIHNFHESKQPQLFLEN
ncbi:hypothetical protein [uncultured Algoriphagus sp.]|uniref:hypothetical protein n=1 Tax=uncultured Algoriphagus sp. TaxID=417365 RepID=UPI0030ED3011|tara:strand:+ start:416 stop:748 length:333 start_codon:yes stop_codon:yes gene_type:complete